MRTVHLFPNGQLEVGTGRRQAYRWVQGYSQVVGRGVVSCALTRRNWYSMGERDGFRCKFHENEQLARQAFDREQ
jgi:hypothetical protein